MLNLRNVHGNLICLVSFFLDDFKQRYGIFASNFAARFHQRRSDMEVFVFGFDKFRMAVFRQI